jgi:hypothetical protein
VLDSLKSEKVAFFAVLGLGLGLRLRLRFSSIALLAQRRGVGVYG